MAWNHLVSNAIHVIVSNCWLFRGGSSVLGRDLQYTQVSQVTARCHVFKCSSMLVLGFGSKMSSSLHSASRHRDIKTNKIDATRHAIMPSVGEVKIPPSLFAWSKL